MECPICFDGLDANKNIMTTECGHKFHVSCILKTRRDDCPCCRQSMILSEPVVSESVIIDVAPVPPPPPPVFETRIVLQENICLNSCLAWVGFFHFVAVITLWYFTITLHTYWLIVLLMVRELLAIAVISFMTYHDFEEFIRNTLAISTRGIKDDKYLCAAWVWFCWSSSLYILIICCIACFSSRHNDDNNINGGVFVSY